MKCTWIIFFLLLINNLVAQPPAIAYHNVAIYPGAYQTSQYIPLLKGKRVGLFANQTSTIGNIHLVDSLQHLGIVIVKIF